MAEFVEISRN